MLLLPKQDCADRHRLLTICIALVFVAILNKSSLSPAWAALGPCKQEFLSLVKDSDVVALIQVDDSKCKKESDDPQDNAILLGSLNPTAEPEKAKVRVKAIKAASGRFCAELPGAVHFKFCKVYKVPSWCKMATDVPQVLATLYTHKFYDKKQYIVFLHASGDSNQWWDISDPSMFFPVDKEQILKTLPSDDEHDAIQQPPGFGGLERSFFPSDASLSDFEKRLKTICSSLPDAAKHKLYSTEQYLKVHATQAHIDEIKYRCYRDDSDPIAFIKDCSSVIDIKPSKEPLLQRAWAYLFSGKVDDAISDINAAIRTSMINPDVLSDASSPYTDMKLGMSDYIKALPSYKPPAPFDPWPNYYQFAEYTTRAYAYLRANRLGEAVADCNAATKCYPEPGWDSGCAILPFCLLHMGKYRQAKDICDQLIANRLANYGSSDLRTKDPGTFLYTVRAHAYIGLRNYEKALADCQQALNLCTRKGWHEDCNKDEGPAVFTYRTMLQEPDISSISIAQAEALEGLKQYAKAKATVDQIVTSRTPLKNECGIGLQLTTSADKPGAVISAVMEDGPARKGGLLVGDQIVEVGGKQTKGWSSEDIANHIRGPHGTLVALSIKRADSTLKFTIKRTYVIWGCYDSTPLLLRAYDLRGRICKELGLASEAKQSFNEARRLRQTLQHKKRLVQILGR
jgi:tetratricopeptide (TPR) repeat protein